MRLVLAVLKPIVLALPAFVCFNLLLLATLIGAIHAAHLHINFSAKARGKGLGSILLNHFTSSLGQAGVHIITGPMERNVFFYEKNGFSFKQEKTYYDTRLLFMGKSLS